MASLQIGAEIGPINAQAGVQLQLSNLEKQVIGAAEKEAQEFLAKNNNNNVQQIQYDTVSGAANNSQSRNLQLKGFYNYFGNFVGPNSPPKNIAANGCSPFSHWGGPHDPNGKPLVDQGSKAAVKYGTYDNDCTQLGYILAWSYKTSGHTSEIKVYVEAKELSKIVDEDWHEIERKLDASCSSISRYFDPATGAEAYANIRSADRTNLAVLGACFNRKV